MAEGKQRRQISRSRGAQEQRGHVALCSPTPLLLKSFLLGLLGAAGRYDLIDDPRYQDEETYDYRQEKQLQQETGYRKDNHDEPDGYDKSHKSEYESDKSHD
jgi:hypothetical protein